MRATAIPIYQNDLALCDSTTAQLPDPASGHALLVTSACDLPYHAIKGTATVTLIPEILLAQGRNGNLPPRVSRLSEGTDDRKRPQLTGKKRKRRPACHEALEHRRSIRAVGVAGLLHLYAG